MQCAGPQLQAGLTNFTNFETNLSSMINDYSYQIVIKNNSTFFFIVVGHYFEIYHIISYQTEIKTLEEKSLVGL